MAEDKPSRDNIDSIFEYVVNKRYPSGMTKNEKANLRRLSKQYFARAGKMYYRHKAERATDNYKELLVIRNRDAQLSITKRVH